MGQLTAAEAATVASRSNSYPQARSPYDTCFAIQGIVYLGTTHALTLSHGGGLYGTTPGGGANSAGTIFKLASGGGFHILYSFCAQPNCADGVNPYPGMVQARDGNFYGTTYNGGTYTYGEIFKISPTGQFAVVYSFCPTVGCADGQAPASPVIQASNGNFYGMTTCGGAHGKGTIFAVTPGGILTTLYSFCSKSNCSDGSYPYAALVQASDGNFYGTTPQGGAYGAGTIFALTPHGFVTLYSFCAQTNCTDGATSYGELIQANDGNLYGTTQLGGTNNLGTVFEITPAGVLTTLHNFAGTDGADPTTGLVQHTDGNLYGTTAVGGLVTTCHPQFGGCGTVFRVSLGLAPFVKTLVSSGKIGSSIVMYGTDLAGATKVTFNGAAATFTVVSATEITAAIPANATTGKIEILNPKGTLSSNAVFHVSP